MSSSLPKPDVTASLRHQRLYRRTYRLRTLGMGVGVLPVAVVLA